MKLKNLIELLPTSYSDLGWLVFIIFFCFAYCSLVRYILSIFSYIEAYDFIFVKSIMMQDSQLI